MLPVVSLLLIAKSGCMAYVMCGYSYVLRSNVSQYISLPHVARVFQSVKPDVIFDPVDVRLFGSEAIVPVANLLT